MFAFILLLLILNLHSMSLRYQWNISLVKRYLITKLSIFFQNFHIPRLNFKTTFHVSQIEIDYIANVYMEIHVREKLLITNESV